MKLRNVIITKEMYKRAKELKKAIEDVEKYGDYCWIDDENMNNVNRYEYLYKKFCKDFNIKRKYKDIYEKEPIYKIIKKYEKGLTK